MTHLLSLFQSDETEDDDDFQSESIVTRKPTAKGAERQIAKPASDKVCTAADG